MSRRWVGWLVFIFCLGAAREASAALTVGAPGDVTFTGVVFNTSAMATRTLTSDVADTVTVTKAGAGCNDITVSPTGTYLFTLGESKTLTFTFTPPLGGSFACTFTFTGLNGFSGIPTATVVVTGTATAPVISTSPAATAVFPDVRVANAAALTSLQIVRISNTGTANLSVTGLAITGSNAGDYTFPAVGLPATILPAGHLDVTITFNPSQSGARLADFEISSDDPALTMPKKVALQGNGTNAVISAADLDFGIVGAGTTASSAIVVTNTALLPVGPLQVASATIMQTSTWFTFAANGSGCAGLTTCNFAGLIVNTTAPVTVRCAPPLGATGAQMATVGFTSDTDGGGDSTSMLTCTAGSPQVMVAPTTLTFADQRVATTSAAQQIVITNSGNSTLHYSIAASGGTPSAFPITAACTTNCSLAMGLAVMVDVKFNPATPTALGTTIHVTSDDPDLVDQDIAVTASGNGIAPQIAAPASLDFMNVELVTPSTLVLTAMNTGGAPLMITTAALSSGGADYTVMGTAGAQTVAVNGSATWMVRCNPSTTGPRPGNFRIVSDSFTGGTTNVTLTCNGLQGALATTPATSAIAPLNFGGVAVGMTQTLPFVLRNPGNVTVTGISGALAPAGVGYSIDPTTPIPTSLMPGATAMINVKFTPASGTDGGAATIMISGTWGAVPTATMVTVFIDGDGLTAGYDVTTVPSTSPPAIDFGSVRWDQTATGFFCIVNTDQAPLTIQTPIDITPTAPTVASEFAVTSVKRNATCSTTGGATANLPQTLATGQILVVTVTADPNNRTGAMAATATITSDLAMNPTRTVALTAMSTTAMLTTTPGLLVDFGSVDRDGPAATKRVTITNTGDGALNLSAFTRTPLTGPFTFVLPADQSVPLGGTVDIDVTYTPTVEQAPGVFEQVVISHNIAGVINGPAMQMITLRGRGIDRHIALDPPPLFPDTFRNPGSMAPVRTVTVRNTGEASLSISAVMLTNADVWQIVDGNPVSIASQGSHDFMVRFVPKVAGKAPVGQLTFMNNDNSVPTPMAVVLLNGNGMDRNVVMGEPEIPFGYTGIGIPVTLDGVLAVTSMDPTNAFTIHSIEIDDAANFHLEQAPADLALPASTTMKFTVTFTPTAEGDFETHAHLFLDEDPTAQSDVKLTGTAVFVDVTGGGGCSTGRDTGTGMVLVLGVLVLRRRRRAAAALVALCVGLLALPSSGRADPNLDLDVSVFNPTPTTTGNGFQVQPASVGSNGTFVGAATVSYATNPLILRFAGNEHVAITQRTTIELGAAYAFLDRFEAGIRMPLYNQAGDGKMVGVASPSGTARGDLVLHGKVQLAKADVGGNQLLAGATLALTLPTASSQEFAGVDKPTGRIYGLVTMLPGALAKRLSFTANLGAVIRQKSSLSNIDQGSGLAWGLGGSVRALDDLWATAEMFGDVMPSGRKATAMSSAGTLAPSEYLVGLSYRAERRVSLGLAVGRGLIAGIGTPDLRGVVSLSFVPGTEALTPLHPPPPPKIDGDADGDGIPDSVDRCPNEPEDKDMFDDTDGCPDPDNDGDGLPDAVDKCPLDAEDKDGFQDEDGCPDKDNDNDGIPDTQDKCPNEPEDKDGFQDLDGCPDPDNDLDGILDAQDKCPNEPETINGIQDDDGCPDRGDALVAVTPSALEATEAVQFTGTKIAKGSTNLLGQVAATLRAHQEIVRLKIVAHVQPSGDTDRDQDLSEKRAQAVRDWLIAWGIPQTRLSAQGLGGQKPLVPRGAKNAQMINDRIEMIILERK